MRVTDKCDVYSFGVVILEVIMGRHPADLLSLPKSSSLYMKDLLDHRLPLPTGLTADQVVFVVSVGLACTRTNPGSRPTMSFVAKELSGTTQPCLSEPLATLTTSKLTIL